MGKSSLALTIAANAAAEGHPVAVFSLERSKAEVGAQLLSMVGKVNSHSLRSPTTPTDKAREQLQNACAEITRWPLYIDDTPQPTITEIRTKSRRLQHQQGLDLVIIDYLQLMPGTNPSTRQTDTRHQEITQITRSLKALAKELNIPVIGISQVTRAVELRMDKRPTLSDLRDSGAIEENADVVMFLYRPSYYNPYNQNQDITEVIIAKHRTGPTPKILAEHVKEHGLFRDYTHHEDQSG
jgi:replicative DNA helicase